MTAEPEAARRTLVRRAVDVAVNHITKLPPTTTRYRVVQDVRVPMRDGVDLLADLFLPTAPLPHGTVLIRAPYGRGYPLPQFYAQPLAARGFPVVVQSVRGTYGSGGEFTPARDETDDGVDTVAWMREQPWFTGTFATIGASYLGLTQWALLAEAPPEYRAAVILAAPHDFRRSWAGGSYNLEVHLGWAIGMAQQESSEPNPLTRRLKLMVTRTPQAQTAWPMPPLAANGRALLGSGAPWFEDWLAHPDHDDPFWEPLQFTRALDEAEVPVLLVNGWQDMNIAQTLMQYRRLRDRGVPVSMTLGPWTHARMLRQGAATFMRQAYDWIDAHIGAGATPPTGVRVHVANHGWLALDDWPVEMPTRSAYLHPGGRLADEPPGDAEPASFTYDPNDPTPSVGGPLMAPDAAGAHDDNVLAGRADVLAFTGEALAHDVYLMGSPRLELRHSADNPHADVFVRLSQVDADGTATSVTEGFLRLPPASSDVDIELDPVAHRFPAGSRLRVLIAGGSYPRFAPNPGTGESISTATQFVPSTHRVHFGRSRLVLPAGDRLPR